MVQGSGLFNFGFWILDFGFIESLRSIRFKNGSGFRVIQFWILDFGFRIY